MRLPWRWLGLAPGTVLGLPGISGAWRVTAVVLDRMVVEVALVRERRGERGSPPADPGRAVGQDDLPHGPTHLELLDIPSLDGRAPSGPRIAVAAAGLLPGWRAAPLLLSLDEGQSWQEAGRTAAPAVIGRALSALGPASAWLFDEARTVDVELLHGAMTLHDATDAALLSGANLAVLGDEILQFRRAIPLGAGRFRLSGLLRGRGGTEAAISSHSAGERFVLVDADALAWVDIPAGAPSIRVLAAGVADNGAAPSALTAPGQAARPLAPVQLAAPDTDAGLHLSWIRRSRAGAAWLDGTDAPLGEDDERYRVTVSGEGASIGFETSEPQLVVAPDAVAAVRPGGGALRVSVSQLGRFGASPAATLSIAN